MADTVVVRETQTNTADRKSRKRLFSQCDTELTSDDHIFSQPRSNRGYPQPNFSQPQVDPSAEEKDGDGGSDSDDDKEREDDGLVCITAGQYYRFSEFCQKKALTNQRKAEFANLSLVDVLALWHDYWQSHIELDDDDDDDETHPRQRQRHRRDLRAADYESLYFHIRAFIERTKQRFFHDRGSASRA